jgi:hypothetical protein
MDNFPVPQMDMSQRLQLTKMVKDTNAIDQTNLIRHLKHSNILLEETNRLLDILKKYECPLKDKSLEDARMECAIASNWLFTYYTDIFNRILKSELDISMFHKFIDILKQIEDGTVDQHEASFRVGTILKEIYIDSALKKSEKLDAAAASAESGQNTNDNKLHEPKIMTWNDYKNKKNNNNNNKLFSLKLQKNI